MTVVKASIGIFGDTMGDRYASTFNPNDVSSNTYNWKSTQTNGACYTQPGIANAFEFDEFKCDVNPAWFTSTLSTLTPTTSSGSLTELPNFGLKEDKTYEYVVRLERQLVPNVSVSVGYVQHRLYNLYDSASGGSSVPGTDLTSAATGTGENIAGGVAINVGRPYSAWIPTTGFTDGQTGAPVAVYTYPTGTAFCNGSCTALEAVNNPASRPDIYHTFELTVTKRYSQKWDALASFWETNDHRWLQGVSGSPNDDRFPIDNTWNWQARGNISYHLPYNTEVSSFLQSASGIYGQRTQTFKSGFNNGVACASCILQQGSVTLRMGPFGEYQAPLIAVLNLKVAKNFSLGESRRIQANFEVFNLLNNAGSTATSYLTGTTFNVVTGIVSPRVARIGGEFSF